MSNGSQETNVVTPVIWSLSLPSWCVVTYCYCNTYIYTSILNIIKSEYNKSVCTRTYSASQPIPIQQYLSAHKLIQQWIEADIQLNISASYIVQLSRWEVQLSGKTWAMYVPDWDSMNDVKECLLWQAAGLTVNWHKSCPPNYKHDILLHKWRNRKYIFIFSFLPLTSGLVIV